MDNPPIRSIGYQLARVLKFKRHFLDLELKKVGLSRTQWQVLFGVIILQCRSQQELLKNLDIDPAYLARTLEKLEELQYIVRRPLKDDRRCLLIEMTEYGKEQVAPHVQAALAKEDALLLRGLSHQEQQHLSKLLLQLEQNMTSVLNSEERSGE